MDERERRAGENEAIFRAVNEQVEDLQRGLAAISDNSMHIVCECGDIGPGAPEELAEVTDPRGY